MKLSSSLVSFAVKYDIENTYPEIRFPTPEKLYQGSNRSVTHDRQFEKVTVSSKESATTSAVTCVPLYNASYCTQNSKQKHQSKLLYYR